MAISDCHPIRFLLERFTDPDCIGLADADCAFMRTPDHKVIEGALRAPGSRDGRAAYSLQVAVAADTSAAGGKRTAVLLTKDGNKPPVAAASCGYRGWIRMRGGRDRVMEPWALITQLASAFREFVA